MNGPLATNLDKTAAHGHAADLAAFVTASPSSFHAAREIADRLEEVGFVELVEREEWPSSPGAFFVVRDGATIAWILPEDAEPATGFHVFGTHTDSPGFKLKPKPTIGSDGWLQAGVEIYGGPLLNSWLDRELLLAGRIVTLDGEEHLTRTGPLLRIPQLAIHLDREINSDGLKLDRQRHMMPVWGLGTPEQADLLAAIAAPAGIEPSEIAGYDIHLADAQAPSLFGADEALLASGRLDNLSSVHAGLAALTELSYSPRQGAPIAVLAAFDHEEVGSASRSGASGPFLADLLTRIGAGLGGRDEDRQRSLASSLCVSADAGHGVHPNYPERHDPSNRPRVGGGPLLKINANQRYTTDAHGAAAWHRICGAAGVPTQEFVSANAMPCGSTIGPLTATRLGVRTLDIGTPLLSMHSAREMCAIEDVYALTLAATEFLGGTA